MQENNSITEQANFVHKFDSDSRGKYLIQSTIIENMIDDILGYHFCLYDTKLREMLIATIIKDLTFSSKITNLIQILGSEYPSLRKSHSRLKKDLEKIRELRNRFAHSSPDTSIDFLKHRTNHIQLEYYKNGRKQRYQITRKFIDRKLVECSEAIFQLVIVLEHVSQGQAQVTVNKPKNAKKK